MHPTALPSSMPVRVLDGRHPWLLWSAAATRLHEEAARTRLGKGHLMRQAGRSVARLALALAPHARRVWVAAGPGGNGGDGLHAAAELQTAGLEVQVCLTGPAFTPGSEAAQALQRAQAAGVRIAPQEPPRGRVDVAIDALLGIGASRAPQGALLEALAALQALEARRIAVDVPSGLLADTGARLGPTAVRADATLALLTLKPGLVTGAGREHVGELWFDDLGCPPSPPPSQPGARPSGPCARLIARGDVAPLFGRRGHDRHKGSFGDVLVVGGAPGMVGAACLAAAGALAAGPGRVFLSLLDEQSPANGLLAPEWLIQPRAWVPGRHALESSTVVCGCGGGDAVARVLPAILARAGRLVLDADALNAVARDPVLRRQLQSRGSAGRPSILTPHPLEAARLLGSDTARVQANRLEAAHALACELRSVVALKGSGTVIACPGELPCVSTTGSASLAGGGSGDVLAGWLGGLWTSGSCPSALEQPDPLARARHATMAGTWLHGRAGELAGEAPVRASELARRLAELAQSWYGTVRQA